MTGDVVEHLRQSKKYRDLCDETLVRVADWALLRYPTLKAATKAAKRKLHQVYGAYVGTIDAGRLACLLDELDPNDPMPICAEILREPSNQRHVDRDKRGEDDLEPAQRFLDAIRLRHGVIVRLPSKCR